MSNKKTGKKAQKELNPLVALAIVGAVVAGGAYFLFGSDSSSTNDYQSVMSTNSTPTKTIIEKVQAPDAKNAPMIIPAQVTDLKVFNNDLTDQQHKVISAKLDAEYAQAQLVVTQLKKKQLEVNSESRGSGINLNDFGVSSSSHPSMQQDGHSDYQNGTITKNSANSSNKIKVVLTSKINKVNAAVVFVNGEYQRVIVGGAIDGTNSHITSINNNTVCYKATGHKKHCQHV